MLTGIVSAEEEVVPVQTQVLVDSHQEIAVRDYNKQIFSAIASGETWPQNPMLLVVRLFRLGGDAQYSSVVSESSGGEAPTSMTFTVMMDGLLDDSIRGIWNEIQLERSLEGNWHLDSLKVAYRCWRGCNQNRYSERLCP